MREKGNTNSRVEGQDRGRLGQIMGVGRNEGKERMHEVDKKMQKETLRKENWKFGSRRDWGDG